jgi:hypothetical protein
VLDPEAVSRVPSAHAPAGGGAGSEPPPHVLQILMTEHWSLLASRSLVFTEAMSRASIFVAALTGSVVALALVSQATDFGDGFIAFALVLFPVDFFLGAVTIVRISQLNREDAIWVQGMNRIRHAYLEMAPELEPYFVTSHYDDRQGVLLSSLAMSRIRIPFQGFIAVPGVIAVLNAVVAGAAAGIAAIGLGASTGVTIAVAVAVFALTLVLFILFARHWVAIHRHTMVVRFPTPPEDRAAAD